MKKSLYSYIVLVHFYTLFEYLLPFFGEMKNMVTSIYSYLFPMCLLMVGPEDAILLLETVSHGALFHAVPGCCKCFQQCRIASKCPNSHSLSYPTLLEAFATAWDSVKQCSNGTLSLVPRSKVASSGPTLRKAILFFPILQYYIKINIVRIPSTWQLYRPTPVK